jgi:hypothetical protein
VIDFAFLLASKDSQGGGEGLALYYEISPREVLTVGVDLRLEKRMTKPKQSVKDMM